jgi:succinate dehydrogenase / fumarate reductase, membrane anchor subunit
MEQNYGSKRIVTGAHYGLRDWLAQRVTAALMVLYTLVLLVQVALTRHARDEAGEVVKDAAGLPLVLSGYDKWASIHSSQWMKVLTFVVIVSLLYHAWVGMRDIWMDYIKPVGVRLLLQVFTLVWLVGCAGWAVQVLWRL